MLPFTSLSAVTSTGPGSSKDLERSVVHHTVIVTATGGPQVTVAIEGSHDGSTWATIGQSASGSSFPLVAEATDSVRYVRANLTSLSGGTSPTVTATIASA